MVDGNSQAILGQPEYSKHWHAVYTGLCIGYARNELDLEFLRFVTEHKEQGLPSWVELEDIREVQYWRSVIDH
ncbi:hypothetical protein AC579_2087 [Pseudocercospora musae]|uniref:Uncharacterized protein n=1 Tax=Pseudocercospora musae TaxID=113226 RepID=A0A139I594_9PEZI|nr:hypothetical protein AC579_2087 [Pseudocercospora musae]